MEKLLCFTVLLAITSSTLGLRSECGLPKDLGPCRFTEPCKPTLFSWNDTFIIVSWEGLFEGCHENQINQMYIKSEGKEVHYNIKVALSKQIPSKCKVAKKALPFNHKTMFQTHIGDRFFLTFHLTKRSLLVSSSD